MKCTISNTCEDKQLCCNFCKNKKCDCRCKDDFKKCKYYVAEKYEKENKS